MANDLTENRNLSLYKDSVGRFLARRRDGDDPEMDDAWMLIPPDDSNDGDVKVRGPQAFGRFLKFCPSDWEEVDDPKSSPVAMALQKL